MTKKHFTELANILRGLAPVKSDIEPANCYEARVRQWAISVEKIASFCNSFNPRFDRVKFYKACGYKEV